ncbi:unnamed protein product [Cyprideis torosa]|uniref:Uncharacterized protein n=1 Tax=Cyprideis torosa TaxID=163714 RepID=A0A7R8ZGV9_9CRUS|nr:unnamed protein product [Cyprideis torosa]CAG0881166.1 unnamed protein product [Cyprideis torosa]
MHKICSAKFLKLVEGVVMAVVETRGEIVSLLSQYICMSAQFLFHTRGSRRKRSILLSFKMLFLVGLELTFCLTSSETMPEAVVHCGRGNVITSMCQKMNGIQ